MVETTPKTPGAPPREERVSGLRMIMTMGGIGLIAGILIVLTYQVTLPVIERNKAAALERAVFEVVPGARSKAAFAVEGDSLRPVAKPPVIGQTVFACYGADGSLVGVATEAHGQGFQDVIHLLYGWSPRRNCIVGMKVLESKETPGLGDKIVKDAAFHANFDSLAVKPTAAGGIAHPVELVKHGEKTKPWQIEAITGATISSRAVTKILRQSTAKMVPLIAANEDVLKKGAK